MWRIVLVLGLGLAGFGCGGGEPTPEERVERAEARVEELWRERNIARSVLREVEKRIGDERFDKLQPGLKTLAEKKRGELAGAQQRLDEAEREAARLRERLTGTGREIR